MTLDSVERQKRLGCIRWKEGVYKATGNKWMISKEWTASIPSRVNSDGVRSQVIVDQVGMMVDEERSGGGGGEFEWMNR